MPVPINLEPTGSFHAFFKYLHIKPLFSTKLRNFLEPIAFICYFILKLRWRKEFRSVGVMPFRELFGIIANEIHNIHNFLLIDWLVGNEVHDKWFQPIDNPGKIFVSR